MSTFTKILKKPIVSAIVAILFGFGVAAIVLASAGYDPAGSFAALFNGALGRPKYIANVIIKATPLLLTGCGVAFAYKAGLFNIGGEGQYICGTVLAVVVGSQVNLPGAPPDSARDPCGHGGRRAPGRLCRLAQGEVWHPRGHHEHHAQLDHALPLQLRRAD
jgi:hypothetical protein